LVQGSFLFPKEFGPAQDLFSIGWQTALAKTLFGQVSLAGEVFLFFPCRRM